MAAGPQAVRRAWAVAHERVRRIDAAWSDGVAREREVLACRHWMEAQAHEPHLAALARLLVPGMSRRQFLAVRVPVERAAGQRVTDVTILADDRVPDAGEPADRMALTLVAESIRSAFNLGGLFRTAECFGAAALWTSGYTALPDHPHAAEAALGTVALVPWRSFENVAEALAELRGSGVTVYALETVPTAVPVAEVAWRFPAALIVGNERFGLDSATVAAADAVIRIPMHGRKNSLNVVTAAGIALHAARQVWQRLARC